MSSSELLRVEGLVARWGSTPVLDGVSLAVGPGEFVVLMGPNGSGKTTLLRAIAGLDAPELGRIRFDGRDLDGVPPHRRGIGFLPQDVALLPGRTVAENIAYGPQLAGEPDGEVGRRVAEMVALFRLEGLERRRPGELSGGERQRAALARTLAPRPKLVLLDEPLAAVDPELRGELRGELRRVFADLGVAAIYVTHDREEGLWLGDRVLLLLGGRLVQGGPPSEVYARPTGTASARFLGYNVLDGDAGPIAVAPRDVRLRVDGPGRPARVRASGTVGGDWLADLELVGGDRLEARGTDGAPPPPGTAVRATWVREVRLAATGDPPPPP